MRMKISVGAMPCVVTVSSQQQFSLNVTNTHAGLRENCRNGVHGGVPDGEEDDEHNLHDQIEHATFNDDGNCSRGSFSWEARGMRVASPVRGDVPDASSDEGGHSDVRA